jgi:hypothetical protein
MQCRISCTTGRFAGLPTLAMRMVTQCDAKSMTYRPESATLTVKPDGF